MAKIPQILIYRNDKGETVLELPGPARRHKVLDPDAMDPWEIWEAIDEALDTREAELADQVDKDELERSLMTQRRTRQIEGIVDSEILGSKIAPQPSHKLTYKKHRIQVHKLASGGYVAYLNGKLIKTQEMDLVAWFREIAYAIRAAEIIVDTNPDEYPHLTKTLSERGNNPRAPKAEQKIYDIPNLMDLD